MKPISYDPVGILGYGSLVKFFLASKRSPSGFIGPGRTPLGALAGNGANLRVPGGLQSGGT